MNILRDEFLAAFRAGAEHGFLLADNGKEPTDASTMESFTEWWQQQMDLSPISELYIPVRAYNALTREGCHTIAQLREYLALKHGTIKFLEMRNIGWRTYEQTKCALQDWDERQQR